MKVKAKHWLKYDGVWHPGGEVFDADDLKGIEEYVEEIEELPKPKRKKKSE